MHLEHLGLTAEILSQFQPYAASGHIAGRVATSIHDEYRVLTKDGEYHAEPSGALLYGALSRAEFPAVGDWVALRVIGPAEAIVQAVLSRRTKFSRRAAGTREDEQVLAANVDVALIVCGLDGDFNPRRIERYLALAHESGIRPIILLSKADIAAGLESKIAAAHKVARGEAVIAISSETPAGLAPLEPHLEPGKTFVLLGSSGVGKSTLLNRLLGEERLRTAAVRESDSRGRHTTTRRELIVLPGGAILIDSPGLRELQVWATHDSLDETFDEIAALAAMCRFRDCTHSAETGCAVRQAVARGELDPGRLESYRKLGREIDRHGTQAALAEKRRWKVIHKAARAHYRLRGR